MPQWLTQFEQGYKLSVYVQPGASRCEVVGEFNLRLKIRVQAPPIDGQANSVLIKFISDLLQIPKSKIEIIRGHQGRNKEIGIFEPSISKEEILKLLRPPQSF